MFVYTYSVVKWRDEIQEWRPNEMHFNFIQADRGRMTSSVFHWIVLKNWTIIEWARQLLLLMRSTSRVFDGIQQVRATPLVPNAVVRERPCWCPSPPPDRFFPFASSMIIPCIPPSTHYGLHLYLSGLVSVVYLLYNVHAPIHPTE